MQREISIEEYKQAFNSVVGWSIIDVFKAAGTELYFILRDKNGEKRTITIDGFWNYDSDDYLFMTEFKNDYETALQLYKRIEIFVDEKLKNKIKNISEFRFSENAQKVSLIFDDQSAINVTQNELGLISITNYQKKEIVLVKENNKGQLSFIHEAD